GAMPHPRLAFGLVEYVEVQYRFPLRVRLAVFGERRAPPQAARVVLVLPQVVVEVADLLDARDLRGRIEDGEDVAFELAEFRLARQFRFPVRVLIAVPGDRLV